MAIGERIIDSHVFKEPADMGLEEAFDLFVVELGVHKDCSNVSLHYIWQTLSRKSARTNLPVFEALPLEDSLSSSNSPEHP